MFANRRVSTWLTAAVTLLLTLAISGPASAQEGEGNFELYLGYFFPDETFFDDDLTYGVRAGYRFADAFGMEGSLGRYEVDVFSIDVEFIFVDLSFVWFTNPGSGTEFFLFGGPGWTFVDAAGFTDDSLTAHAGLGLRIPLGEKVYLRPDARVRWFDDGGDSTYEASLALGFRFGG